MSNHGLLGYIEVRCNDGSTTRLQRRHLGEVGQTGCRRLEFLLCCHKRPPLSLDTTKLLLQDKIMSKELEQAISRADEAERQAKVALNKADVAEKRADEFLQQSKVATEKLNAADTRAQNAERRLRNLEKEAEEAEALVKKLKDQVQQVEQAKDTAERGLRNARAQLEAAEKRATTAEEKSKEVISATETHKGKSDESLRKLQNAIADAEKANARADDATKATKELEKRAEDLKNKAVTLQVCSALHLFFPYAHSRANLTRQKNVLWKTKQELKTYKSSLISYNPAPRKQRESLRIPVILLIGQDRAAIRHLSELKIWRTSSVLLKRT